MSESTVEGFELDEDFYNDADGSGELVDSEFEGMGVVYIDRKGCIRCTHLLGELGKKTYTCTEEEGNINCPASRYTIVIGMDVDGAVSTMVESVQNSDIDSIIQILTDVKEKNPVVVQDFMRELCDRLGVEFDSPEELEDDLVVDEEAEITEEQEDEIEEDEED